MKIDPNNVPSVGQSSPSDQARANEAQRAAATERRSEAVDRDEARLSVDGGKLDTLRAEVAKQPEVRQERVAELQQSIREGRFQVSNDQIAEAIFNELTSGTVR